MRQTTFYRFLAVLAAATALWVVDSPNADAQKAPAPSNTAVTIAPTQPVSFGVDFIIQGDGSSTTTTSFGQTAFTVPPGQRLVLESLTTMVQEWGGSNAPCMTTLDAGTATQPSWAPRTSQNTLGVASIVTPLTPTGVLGISSGTSQSKVYADPGTVVQVTVTCASNDVAFLAQAYLSFLGYLVPAP